MPVYLGTREIDSSEEDIALDMDWTECGACGCVQLCRIPIAGLVYPKFHSEASGPTWDRHFEAFQEFIQNSSAFQKERLSLLEVGGSDGRLAQRLMRLRPGILRYLVVEPNLEIGNELQPSAPLQFINDFIENQLDEIYGHDLVIHSHVIEHLIDPLSTLEAIVKRMSLGSEMIFSVPNQLSFLQLRGANALNFEHTYFFSTEQWTVLIENLGLTLQSISFFEQHSVFFSFRKEPSANRKRGSVGHFSVKGELISLDIAVREVALSLQKELELGTQTWLFGAHIFSQMILTRLGQERRQLIQGLLDNSDVKHGQKLYGFDLVVQRPSYIGSLPSPVVGVMAGPYQVEIVKQLAEINPTVRVVAAR